MWIKNFFIFSKVVGTLRNGALQNGKAESNLKRPQFFITKWYHAYNCFWVRITLDMGMLSLPRALNHFPKRSEVSECAGFNSDTFLMPLIYLKSLVLLIIFRCFHTNTNIKIPKNVKIHACPLVKLMICPHYQNKLVK